MPGDEDRLVGHSDAALATIDADGHLDETAFHAAVLAVGRDVLFGELVAAWTATLAFTHAREERPLAAALERVGDEQVRSRVHRTCRAMTNLSRVMTGDTAAQVELELGRTWDPVHRHRDWRGPRCAAAGAGDLCETGPGGLGRAESFLRRDRADRRRRSRRPCRARRRACGGRVMRGRYRESRRGDPV